MKLMAQCIPEKPKNKPVEADKTIGVISVPFYMMNTIEEFWCMPCCLVSDLNNPKMPLCSSITTKHSLSEWYFNHGKCGEYWY